MQAVKVALGRLAVDEQLWGRAGLNQDAVARYAELFAAGRSKAVAVQAGTGRVIDGVHRLHAAREAGLEEILAVEHRVVDKDLRALAYRLNREHGVPCSREERDAITTGFKTDERFGQRHPGNLPAALVRNLLCFYSRPGDVILDPFCGGGVVLDVARDMVGRTAYGFDPDPRRPDVAKWDITGGPPPVPRAPDLTFLDPPYAGMKKGQYSGHPSELSDMTVEGFLKAMGRIFGYWDRGRLVLVMGCLRREGEFVALPYECARRMEGKGWRLVDWVVNQVHRPASESGITVATQRRQRVVMRSHVDVVVGEKEPTTCRP